MTARRIIANSLIAALFVVAAAACQQPDDELSVTWDNACAPQGGGSYLTGSDLRLTDWGTTGVAQDANQVTFKDHIKPMLEQHSCTTCHHFYAKPEGVIADLKNGELLPAVGPDGDMPRGGSGKLTQAEIDLFGLWEKNNYLVEKLPEQQQQQQPTSPATGQSPGVGQSGGAPGGTQLGQGGTSTDNYTSGLASCPTGGR